jgi:hypothetical protein
LEQGRADSQEVVCSQGTVHCASRKTVQAEGETMSQSILQPWVSELGLRHQGVLMTAIRGCDGAPKHDLSKPLMRAIRWAVLVPFDPRELDFPKGFMYFQSTDFCAAYREFAKNIDEYPLHFILHLLHATEVIAYKMPRVEAHDFLEAYVHLVHSMHLRTEPEASMDDRLREDRIALKTVGQ